MPAPTASARWPVLAAAVLAIAGLCLNDWLPTGLLDEVGALGNNDRRNALRTFSVIAPLSAFLLFVFRNAFTRNLGNIALMLISTLFAFAIFVAVDVKLSAAMIKESMSSREIMTVHEPDSLLGWRPQANSVGRHREAGSFDVKYVIDAAGRKAVPNVGEPRARLFILGDSYTFGHGVTNEITYANVIAREYLQPSVHVFNLGVMGYGLEQMYGRFLEIEAQLTPNDIVLFAPTSQDIKRNLKDFVFPSKLVFSESLQFGNVYPYYDRGRLEARDLVTDENRRVAALLNGRWTRKMFRFLHSAIMSPPTTAEALEMIKYAKTKTTARGASFALIFLPQTKECRKKEYEEDISFFDYIDVMSAFPKDGDELSTLRFVIDSHWNEKGHRIAARAIVNALRHAQILGPQHLLSVE